MKVLYVRESLFESWGKDLFTFGCLFAGWYLNHQFTGGSWAIDLTIAIMAIFGAIGRVSKRYKPQEAIGVLRELVRQDKGSHRAQTTNRPITSSAKCSFCGAESAIMFPVCSTCRGNMPG